MRIGLFSFLIAVTILHGANAQVPTEKWLQQATLEDPVFGIAYRPSIVKFDVMPKRISQLCPGFGNELDWVFAHYKSGSSDYYIVMGVSESQDGDSFGTGVWIDGSRCRMSESKWVFLGTPSSSGFNNKGIADELPGLNAPRVCDSGAGSDCHYLLRSAHEEEILKGLIGDAIQRSIAAYGSGAAFKRKACSSDILRGNAEFPLVAEALRAFCAKPSSE